MKYGVKITSLTNPSKRPSYWGEVPFDKFSNPQFHKSDGTFITNDINFAFSACAMYRSTWYGATIWGFSVEERE